MVIAVPKEILPGENRVSIVPDVASKLIKKGFSVNVESNAGFKAGFTDAQYEEAGAKVFSNLEEVYSNADIVLKVQRPLEHPDLNKHEADLIKEGSLLITFMYALHYTDDAKLWVSWPAPLGILTFDNPSISAAFATASIRGSDSATLSFS